MQIVSPPRAIRIVPILGAIAFAFLGAARADESRQTAETPWPQFRGEHASGIAEGQNLPDRWDAAKSENILWKTPIPGLAHSSPIVWGDRVFVTSAVSGAADATFRHGLFGSGDASPDLSPQKWIVYCVDKKSGAILWERAAREGVPRSKRHVKASYANSTPATDGRRVVAFFGSEGLYAYDMEGGALWKKDLGDLDVGAYDVPDYEWGPASSPIIHGSRVIVQCDAQHDSFIIACDLNTGETIWKTMRDEIPSWGTPTVIEKGGRAELVTNASNFIRGYDPADGRELWRLGGSSKITAPTPIFAEGLIVVASGRRNEMPIFVIRPGAVGDITLAAGETASEQILWSKTRVGPYMPTPLAYRGILYILQNEGILAAYDLLSGLQHYRKRIPHAGAGFSASPVAADGKIYLSSEDGDVFVIAAGPNFEVAAAGDGSAVISSNPMGERLMATPAISGGMMLIRGEHTLFAVGAPE